MSKPSSPVVLLVLGASLGLTACPSAPPSDAGDAATDVSHGSDSAPDVVDDNTIVDDFPADAGQDVQLPNDAVDDVAVTDGATDAAADGGTCTGTADPLHQFLYYPTAWLWHYDASPSAGAASVYAFLYTNHGQLAMPATPTARQGDCVYFAIGSQGTDALNAAHEVNYGTLTVHTPSQPDLVATYDTTMLKYNITIPMTYAFAAGNSMGLDVGGFPDATTAGTATLLAPPTFNAASVTAPDFTRDTDTVVTYQVPAEALTAAESDLVVQYEQFDDSDRNQVIVCAVPACRGSVTVPHALMQNIAAGTAVRAYVNLVRQTPVPPDGRPLQFRVANGVRFLDSVH